MNRSEWKFEARSSSTNRMQKNGSNVFFDYAAAVQPRTVICFALVKIEGGAKIVVETKYLN